MLSILFQFVFSSMVLFSTALGCVQIFYSSWSSYSRYEIWLVSTCLGLLSAFLALMGLKSVVLANFVQYAILVACNVIIIVLGIKNFRPMHNNHGAAANVTLINDNSFVENFVRLWDVTKSSGRGNFFVFEENFRYVSCG